MNSKIVALKKRYYGLPPDVIISCILSFHEMDIGMNAFNMIFLTERSRYKLFGYFKRDPSRNVYFLFKCLAVPAVTVFIVNLRSVETLLCWKSLLEGAAEVTYPTYSQEKQSIFGAKNYEFRSLKKLFFHIPSLREDEIENQLNFFANNRFDRLKYLKIVLHLHDCLETFLVKGLEKLQIQTLVLESDCDIGAGDLSSIPEFESFSDSKVISTLRTNLKTLSIERIYLYDVSSLFKSLRLESLAIKNCHPITHIMRDLNVMDTTQLKTLKLKFMKVIDPDFDENKLIIIRLPKCEVLKLSTNEVVKSIRLKRFDLSQNQCLQKVCLHVVFTEEDASFFTNTTFNKLEILEINDIGRSSKVELKKWNPFPNLKSLTLGGDYGRRILQDSSFSLDLTEKLSVFECSFDEQIGMKVIVPNIREIRLRKCRNVGNTFFQTNEFRKLSFLYIDKCSGCTGMGWKEMNMLDELNVDLMGIDLYVDFLDESKFMKLKELIIGQVNNIVSTSIKGTFPTVEFVKLFSCPNVQDEFFQKELFPKLEDLVIQDCPLVKGIDWNIPTLKRINIVQIACRMEIFETLDIRRFKHLNLLEISCSGHPNFCPTFKNSIIIKVVEEQYNHYLRELQNIQISELSKIQKDKTLDVVSNPTLKRIVLFGGSEWGAVLFDFLTLSTILEDAKYILQSDKDPRSFSGVSYDWTRLLGKIRKVNTWNNAIISEFKGDHWKVACELEEGILKVLKDFSLKFKL